MKKMTLVLAVLTLLVCILSIPASAAEMLDTGKTEIIYVDGLGEVTVTTVTEVYDSVARSSQKSVSKTQKIEYGGQLVATVTLKATFGYDGSDAWVVSSSGVRDISSGWSYSGQSIAKNGGSVTLTATLSKGIGVKIPISITMTCSPTGTIS